MPSYRPLPPEETHDGHHEHFTPETGRFSNTSDVVRNLIRREQERTDKIAAMQRFADKGYRERYLDPERL